MNARATPLVVEPLGKPIRLLPGGDQKAIL